MEYISFHLAQHRLLTDKNGVHYLVSV